MKKTSIFLLLVTFLASIFLVSFFGAKVIDEQFKNYIRSVEILTYTGIKPSSGEKYYLTEFKENEENYVTIDYNVTFSREGVSEAGLIEFVILGEMKTFVIEETGEEKPYAEFISQSVLMFNHPCVATVRLRTTNDDGSGHYDDCQFICRANEQEN